MSVWIDWQEDIPNQEAIEKLIRVAIDASLAEEGVETPVQLSVSIVSEEEIQQLNADFRQIDRVTDVLSFPLLEYGKLSPAEEIKTSEVDPDTGEVCLGDIVICYPVAVRQAAEYGHSTEREMGFLTVHSMLHLMGYDHMEAEEERQMIEKQEKILEGIGLAR